MAKIYMETRGAPPRQIARFGREALEDFPEVAAPASAPPEAAAEPAEDLVALREAVLAEARAEAERKVAEAYEKGFARGEQAGREAFDASLARCCEALETAAQAMLEAREGFLASLEPQVVEIVKLIAARVLDREIRGDTELLRRNVRRALGCLADGQSLRIRVHPADLLALREHEVTLLDDFPGVAELEILADESITPGGCMVDSETLHVDARLETLLANVLEAISE